VRSRWGKARDVLCDGADSSTICRGCRRRKARAGSNVRRSAWLMQLRVESAPQMRSPAYGPQGQPERLRVLWALTKPGSFATCELWIHPQGWQVQLKVNASTIAGSLHREYSPVQELADRWRVELVAKGWLTVGR